MYLNIMTTSASCLPQKTVLSKYMDSKMIRKGFQSIKNQFQQVCLQLTEKVSILL